MNLLNNAIVEALSFTLFHVSWLSAFIVIIAAFILNFNKKQTSSFKGGIILGAMSLILVLTGIFLSYALWNSFNIEDATSLIPQTANGIQVDFVTESHLGSFSLKEWLIDRKYNITILWMIGAGIIFMRFLMALGYVFYIKNKVIIADDKLYKSQMARLSKLMNYSKRSIRLGFSTMVDSPILVGIIKPIIIFPIGLINQLSNEEVEAVLAHEIAHLVRKDHFINVAMICLETIFYFHPGVWWLTSQMKKYREEACDDRALLVVSDKIDYVKTLIKIQEFSKVKTQHSLTLAMTGSNKSNFYNRIKRLLNMEVKSKSIKSQFLVLASIILIAFFVSKNTASAKSNDIKDRVGLTEYILTEKLEKDIPSSISSFLPGQEKLAIHQDTLPSKSKSVTKIIKKTDNEEVELDIENGEVTKLIIDGKEVPSAEYKNHEKLIDQYKGNDNVFIFGNSDVKVKRFDFPNGGDEAFSFSFGDSDIEIANDKRILLDSFFKGNFNDSVFVFPFDGGEELNWERFEFDRFPEGFNFQEFPGMIRLELSDLDNQIIELENWIDKEGDLHEFRNFPKKKEGGDFSFERKDQKLEDIIGSQLNRDGFLLPDKENTILLTGKYLKINGEKQPSNIWNKYKSLFEQETGVPLHKKSRLAFSIIGKDTNKRYKAF